MFLTCNNIFHQNPDASLCKVVFEEKEFEYEDGDYTMSLN